MPTIRVLIIAAVQVLIVLAATVYGTLSYLTEAPGTSYARPLPSATPEETAIADALRKHVATLAARPRNLAHYEDLEKAAAYIEATLESQGFVVERQSYDVGGRPVHNIAVSIEPARPSANPTAFVIGAHYDSAVESPGANANASGTASVLELAHRLRDLNSGNRLRLVLFVNGEPPYFQTEQMGSLRYAKALAARSEPVMGMFSLDTLGCYTSTPGSQRYPPLASLVLPDRGDFVAFVGGHSARPFMQRSLHLFRSHTQFPSRGWVGPGFHLGMDTSDNWAFVEQGYPALLITDTGPYRYPHYGQPADTPDKIDYEKMARVVKGIERVVRELNR